MPIIAIDIPVLKLAEKPDPIKSDTTISFLDVIEIILKIIVDGAKAIFPKRKGKRVKHISFRGIFSLSS